MCRAEKFEPAPKAEKAPVRKAVPKKAPARLESDDDREDDVVVPPKKKSQKTAPPSKNAFDSDDKDDDLNDSVDMEGVTISILPLSVFSPPFVHASPILHGSASFDSLTFFFNLQK